MKQLIVSMGGGFSSTAWLPRIVLKKYKDVPLHFVTSVLPNEHSSMWKLYDAVEEKLGIEVTYIAYSKESKWQYVAKEDRSNEEKLYTPFDIFNEVNFLGNSRFDPCSRMLKRETMLNYLEDQFIPEEVRLAVGIHADEIERTLSIRENWNSKGYETVFPLLNYPHVPKDTQLKLLKRWYGVSLDLYELGFEHNNCAGACVKAGQRQWALLWYYYPHVYKKWEEDELKWRLDNQDGEHTIIKKMVKGKYYHITLRQFREKYLEPALLEDQNNFLSRYLNSLSKTPACVYCSAL